MEVVRDALARWPESKKELLLVSMGAPCEQLLPLARGEKVLEAVLLQIKAIPGVARTTSTVVLNTEFEDQPLRLPEA